MSMQLSNEIFEWRKQLVEKLLLNGVKPKDLEEQVNAAELVVFNDKAIEACRSEGNPPKDNLLNLQMRGHNLLKELLKKADLSEDQLNCINLFIFPQQRQLTQSRRD